VSYDCIGDHFEEFQSPRFRGESMIVFELLLVAGWLAVPALWRRRNYAGALLLVALGHAALASVRHVLLYVMAAAPVVAAEISAAIGRGSNSWSRAAASLAADYAPAAKTKLWLPVCGAGALIAAVCMLDSGPARWRVDFPAQKFP